MTRAISREMAQDIYSKIYTNEGYGYWLTLSPPSCKTNVNCLHDMYMKTVEKLLKCSTELIGVVEFSTNMRYHLHICFRSTNARARYIVINSIREEHVWQVMLLKGPPEKGFDYLFKEIDDSCDILGFSPLFCRKDLLKKKKLRLIEQQNLNLLKKDNILDKGVPDWMLAEDSE